VAAGSLAKTVLEGLSHDPSVALRDALSARLTAFHETHGSPVGILGVTRRGADWTGWWGFQAPSMGVAFFAPTLRWPIVRMGRRDCAFSVGTTDSSPSPQVTVITFPGGVEEPIAAAHHDKAPLPGVETTPTSSVSGADDAPPAKAPRIT